VKLRGHLGDNFPLVKVKDRLRCERCSSRQIVITFLAPNQRTGNVYLFGDLPRTADEISCRPQLTDLSDDG
jgi:hypothetical protein